MVNYMHTYFIVPTRCLDWHKALKNCDSRCFVHTNFIMYTILMYLIYILNIKENNNSLMREKHSWTQNLCKHAYNCNTYTHAPDRYAAQIDVYTQAHKPHTLHIHTAHTPHTPHTQTHTQCASLTHTQTHTHMHTHTHLHLHTHVCMHTMCTHTTYMHTCAHIMCVHTTCVHTMCTQTETHNIV